MLVMFGLVARLSARGDGSQARAALSCAARTFGIVRTKYSLRFAAAIEPYRGARVDDPRLARALTEMTVASIAPAKEGRNGCPWAVDRAAGALVLAAEIPRPVAICR